MKVTSVEGRALSRGIFSPASSRQRTQCHIWCLFQRPRLYSRWTRSRVCALQSSACLRSKASTSLVGPTSGLNRTAQYWLSRKKPEAPQHAEWNPVSKTRSSRKSGKCSFWRYSAPRLDYLIEKL
jgi:hypothetical protein